MTDLTTLPIPTIQALLTYERSIAPAPYRDEVVRTLLLDRQSARRKALDSLGKYKFWMFGYWAADWVKINRRLPTTLQEGSPFTSLVKLARETMEAETC